MSWLWNSAYRHRSNLFHETSYSSFWNFLTRCQRLFANSGSAWCHVPANAEHGTVQNCYHGWRSTAGEFRKARNWSSLIELSSVSIYRQKAHLKRLLLATVLFQCLEHSEFYRVRSFDVSVRCGFATQSIFNARSRSSVETLPRFKSYATISCLPIVCVHLVNLIY